jgi:hypothetical protein
LTTEKAQSIEQRESLKKRDGRGEIEEGRGQMEDGSVKMEERKNEK